MYTTIKSTRRVALENLRKDLRNQVKWAESNLDKSWKDAPPEIIIQERIAQLRERATSCTYTIPEISVQHSGNQDKLGNLVADIADLDALLVERERQNRFIESVPDTQMREMLRGRFILCLSWNGTSQLVGDYYSEDYVRITTNRFLAKSK